jgi:hypothetical protein
MDLGTLRESYTWINPPLVSELLRRHPEVHAALMHAATIVPDYFGADARLSLRAVSERDGDGTESLFAYIHTDQSPEEALANLDRFDRDWWLGAMPHLYATLAFGLRFA